MQKRLLVPHHVTGFWAPRYSGDPVRSGSIGAGLLLEYAEAVFGGDAVVYNGLLLERAGVGVSIKSPYPLGYGYAASAVVNIAKAFAAYGDSPRAFVEAHVSEVKNMTGLGDVLAIYTGGCLVVRTAPGAPGVGSAYGVECPKAALVTLDMAPASTASMLQSRHSLLVAAGEEIYAEFVKEPTFERFLELAQRFSKRLGFLPPWAEELKKTRGVVGLYAKKGVLAVVAELEWARDVAEFLATRGAVHVSKLEKRFVHLA